MDDTAAQVSHATFWQNRYDQGQTNWDAGSITTPLKTYIDQLDDRHQRILIAGAGNAHEGAYLHQQGFDRVFLLDFATAPLERFAKAYPDFPPDHLLCQDFFDLDGLTFDLILEQTFFCAIHPNRRQDYAKQMHHLLATDGKLVGVLFDWQFETSPPFSGSIDEYLTLFSEYFYINTMAPCYNSIPARQGKELFIHLTKK